MKFALAKGTTSKLLRIFIQDTSQTDGRGLTGLVYNSASLTAYYIREGAAAPVSISLVTMTVGTWVSGGFKEIDSTNMPGWYEFGIPDACLASGADSVGVHFKGATNMAAVPLEIQLTGVDLNDATAAGISRLDAAVSSRLAPTTAGRTLDVTATGEAGIDLDNTAGTLAKGTDLTGFNDLDAAGVRSAVGLGSANLDNQLDALPTNAELATALGTADDATLAAIAALNNLSSAQAQAACAAALAAFGAATEANVSLRASQTSVDDVPTNAELTAALASADDSTLAAIASLNNVSIAQIQAAIAAGDDPTLAAIAALNNLSSAQVQVAAAAALTAYDPPTHAEMTAELATADDATLSAIAGLNDLNSTDAQAACLAALTAYGAALESSLLLVKTVTDKLDTALQASGLNYQFTEDALALGSVSEPGGDATQAKQDEIIAQLGTIESQTSLIVPDTEINVLSSIQGSTIYIKRGDTFNLNFSGLGDISDRTKLWFTVKDGESDEDDKSVVQIEESGGLLYLKREAASDSLLGTLTVSDEATGAGSIVLKPDATEELRVKTGLKYDFQILRASGTVKTLTQGSANVVGDVTRAIS